MSGARTLGMLALGVALSLVVRAPAAAPGVGPPASGSAVVKIHVTRTVAQSCSAVVPLRRTVTRPKVLTGAMRALLRGVTAVERRRGYTGWFSTQTAGSLRSVRIVRGVAYIDFRNFSRLIPGASSSCGSELLLAQLDRTAMQFPSVRRTVYSFDGSRPAFYEWLMREAP